MAKRIGLGRGLDALLDNNPSAEATPEAIFRQSLEETGRNDKNKKVHGNILQIPLDSIFPDPGQPRKKFNETELEELAASIKSVGLINPIIVSAAGDDNYMIVAGERRYRASKLAGLNSIAALVVSRYTDQKRLEVSLVENIQRTDLNPIEEAAAYKNLMDFSKLTQDELAARVGKNRTTVANSLRLLKLPIEMQKGIVEEAISSGHARALLSVTDARAREVLYKEIIAKKINVREAEKRASQLNEGKKQNKSGKNQKSKSRPPEIDAMAEKFIGRLGTKVIIDGDLNKGRILIDYYSMEDLERLYEILGG